MTPTDPGGEPPDGSAPHVLVTEIRHPVLDEPTAHHLRRVRRLRPGDRLTATDGAGRWRWCRLGTGPELAAEDEIVAVPRPTPPVTVAFALTKGDKPELVVQKLTELGVDRIVPFRAARSVVRWDQSRAAAHAERWRAVARSALEQSHRCWLPQVDDVADVHALVRLGAVRVDRGGRPPSLASPTVAVGPEGGWDDAERAALPDAVGLGPHVLRAETAALTAGGVLCSIRSGLVRELADPDPRPGKPG